MPLKSHDDILIFYRKLPTYNPQYFYSRPRKYIQVASDSKNYRDGYARNAVYENLDGKRYPRDTIKFNYPKYLWGDPNSKTEHPTQKPVDLIEYLIKTYTNEGELVLDATIGSGTTAVAAINTNRHFIGFELDEKYYNIANSRIAEAHIERESKLFKEVTA